MFKEKLLFPLAAAINLFSVTGLLILSGLLGYGNLAADIAIIQGAVLAIFHSLSANARNLILASGSSEPEEKNLFYFRLAVILPAIVAVYLLANSVIEIPEYLFAGLVIRKCCEWLAELQLANREVRGDFGFARRYVVLNASGFALLFASLAFTSSSDVFALALFAWAILPVVLCIDYLRFVFSLKQVELNFSKLVPHMGSTTVIGVSTYIFRVLVVIMVGKSLAGQMFTAYAIGGVVSSVYVYALGPSLVLRNEYHDKKGILLFVCGCFFLGTVAILSALFWENPLYAPIFLYAIGFSLMGGGVMILAQRQRLHILQVFNKDVFVPDALSNILFIGSIPFAYYLIGVNVVSILFLWSAFLAFIFYIPFAYRRSAKC